jgi:hypothetical protein
MFATLAQAMSSRRTTIADSTQSDVLNWSRRPE